ncbi:hypothetical protein WDU94_012641 [Cyamophila willieti]
MALRYSTLLAVLVVVIATMIQAQFRNMASGGRDGYGNNDIGRGGYDNGGGYNRGGQGRGGYDNRGGQGRGGYDNRGGQGREGYGNMGGQGYGNNGGFDWQNMLQGMMTGYGQQ